MIGYMSGTEQFPVRGDALVRIYVYQYLEYWAEVFLVIGSIIPGVNALTNYFILQLMQSLEDNIQQALLEIRLPYNSYI